MTLDYFHPFFLRSFRIIGFSGGSSEALDYFHHLTILRSFFRIFQRFLNDFGFLSPFTRDPSGFSRLVQKLGIVFTIFLRSFRVPPGSFFGFSHELGLFSPGFLAILSAILPGSFLAIFSHLSRSRIRSWTSVHQWIRHWSQKEEEEEELICIPPPEGKREGEVGGVGEKGCGFINLLLCFLFRII